MKRVAIDCDLRKIYAVTSDGIVLANAVPHIAALREALYSYGPDEILFEIASPVDYTSVKAIAFHKRRWVIFNVSMATILEGWWPDRLLVAPSHVWTKGYGLAARHKLAKTRQKNKDLRECEAMLASRTWAPKAWVPLPTFLDSL
jgi:hypothetical protein